MAIIIKKNNEIDDKLLEKIYEFDLSFFPEDTSCSFPKEYFYSLYSNSKDGLFVILEDDEIIGYVNAIFLTDAVKEKYLGDKKYLELKNVGLNVGANNMYFYTLAIASIYQDTPLVKLLMYAFCSWLKDMENENKYLKSVICDVVSLDGLKSARTMGLLPLEIHDDGMGLYYSDDNLRSYIGKMLEWGKENNKLQIRSKTMHDHRSLI